MNEIELKAAINETAEKFKSLKVVLVVNGCTVSENENITGCSLMTYSKSIILSNNNIVHYIDKINDIKVNSNVIVLNFSL